MINSPDLSSQDYLQDLYATIQKCLPYQPEATYGEVLPIGIDQLLAQMELTETDFFLDLGSGRGKLLCQVFLQTPVQSALGIEMCSSLHNQAIAALRQIKLDLKSLFVGRELLFLEGNFLTYDFKQVTVCFINATCFPTHLIQSLSILLDKAKTLRLIMATRPIPLLAHFVFKKSFQLECSWDTTLCYLYRRIPIT